MAEQEHAETSKHRFAKFDPGATPLAHAVTQSPQLDLSTPPEASQLIDILVADFNYIAQTAFQTNEDRVRATTYYLLSIGTVLAAIFASSAATTDPWRTAVAFAVVFFALAVLGMTTLFQLARLRVAWFSSVRAMNHLKRTALDMADLPQDAAIFPWTDKKLPKSFEPGGVGTLQAIQTLVMASIMFGACAYQVSEALNLASAPNESADAISELGKLTLSCVSAVIWGALCVFGYWMSLRSANPSGDPSEAENE